MKTENKTENKYKIKGERKKRNKNRTKIYGTSTIKNHHIRTDKRLFFG